MQLVELLLGLVPHCGVCFTLPVGVMSVSFRWVLLTLVHLSCLVGFDFFLQAEGGLHLPPLSRVVAFLRLGDQSKDRLGRGVCLGKHRRAGLLQDVQPGQVRTLAGDIHIRDSAVCRLEVVFVNRQHICCKRQAGLL